MSKKNIYFFIGTTAELIKIAPVIRELEAKKIPFKLISSGQNNIHFDSLKGFIKIQKADIAFLEKTNKSSVYIFLFWAVKTFFKGFMLFQKELKNLEKANTYCIIHGDTVSSSLGACIAKLHGIKIVHIESGDLSFNLLEPFPEEICRNINIQLADILFPPTQWAKDNLKKFKKPVISTQQNTIIETFLWAMGKKRNIIKLKDLKKYYVIVMHRQEHVVFKKNWSRDILDYVINNANVNLTCVILNHPLTIEILNSLDLKSKKRKIKRMSQMPYHDFLQLLNNSEFIATDSATLQQEAYYMGKPLLALRNYTEQIEGVGENYVLSKGDKKIMEAFLNNYNPYKMKPITIKQKPSQIIVNYLLNN